MDSVLSFRVAVTCSSFLEARLSESLYAGAVPRRIRTLAELGESALIERIRRRAGHPPGRVWPKGIGDDAAILRPRPTEDLVLSTDAQVEGVHFLFSRESPRTIGRRAAAVNLSDLAAMGAAPVGVLMSLCAPPDMKVSVFDGILDGFVSESGRFDCPLVGGNLSRAEKCSLTVTIVGRVARGRALRRDGLRVGDELFVTGQLGAAALARLRADRRGGPLRRVPEARIAAGRALARMRGVHACIDVSDGLVSDLLQLLARNGLGAEIDWGRLPSPRGFEKGCAELGLDSASLLIAGGEDYELLFGLGGGAGVSLDADWLTVRLGVAVTRIGRVVRRPGLPGLPVIPLAHHF